MLKQLATLLSVTSILLPFWKHCRSNIRLCRMDDISVQNSFDIVVHFSSKIERCFDIVAENGNNVIATFDFVAFDNVAFKLLLVWTGFKVVAR